jgi:hypothetical protein
VHCINRNPKSLAAVVRNIWRGEIGLYRAAYGLGGVEFAFASLLGDIVLSLSRWVGGVVGWTLFGTVGLGEIAFAWICVVVTSRAARSGWSGQHYGHLAIGLALTFVGSQLIFTAIWIAWTGLAGLGVLASPDVVLARSILAARP